ncbi:hypothetical protein SKAU_G00003210 [Synaphobranchus kaupii]|uniref:Uncharacterized protein n=1 Tax=Synaphobranchus kaupii TaxID=118154 RepID=A0A9Q1JBF2_SYNKA|nr:hypothetical protein SKAU_G00003210 [Synaphobranchus kaupii]
MRSPQLSGARPSDFHTAPGVPHLLRVLRNRKSTALKNLRDVCCKLSSEVLGRSQGKEEVLFWHRQASAEHGTEASMPRRSPPPSFSPRSKGQENLVLLLWQQHLAGSKHRDGCVEDVIVLRDWTVLPLHHYRSTVLPAF